MATPTPPNPPSPQPNDPPHRPSPRTRPAKEPADRAPSNTPPAHGRHHGVTGEPILRRTLVRPAGIVPDPVDSAYVANRLTALTHELANLLDGSLRVISIARRNVPADTSAGPESTFAPGELTRHLDTVFAAMVQMADLVRNSMANLPPSPGGLESIRRAFGSTGTVAAAANHAVNVMLPLAEDRNIQLTADISADLGDIPAGSIYSIITSAIRNAIESIERAGRSPDGTPGRIDVRAWMEAGRTGRCVAFEIADNGEGPPPASVTRGRSVFDYGFTCKAGSLGIGLALCRELVEQLGGTIDLIPAPSGGAMLKVRYPAPAPMSDRPLGTSQE